MVEIAHAQKNKLTNADESSIALFCRWPNCSSSRWKWKGRIYICLPTLIVFAVIRIKTRSPRRRVKAWLAAKKILDLCAQIGDSCNQKFDDINHKNERTKQQFSSLLWVDFIVRLLSSCTHTLSRYEATKCKSEKCVIKINEGSDGNFYQIYFIFIFPVRISIENDA